MRMYSTQDLVEMLGIQRKESIVGARGGVEEGSLSLNRDRPYVLAVTGTNLGNERGAFQSSHTDPRRRLHQGNTRGFVGEGGEKAS